MATSLCAGDKKDPNELGDFLRSRRVKLTPEIVGLKTGRRRRTPGLRREEVAELAGIGIDWYIRLEQGRAVAPSATTLTSLSKALRLSKVEDAHLYALSKRPARPAFVRESVPETLRRMVNSLPHPAYITGQRWDLLVWNQAAAEALMDFAIVGQDDRNLLLQMLTAPQFKLLFGPAWHDAARRMVEIFRATYDLWPGDPRFSELLKRCRRECPEFSGWWETHDVQSASGQQKLLEHPVKGSLLYETTTFQANDNPCLRLAIFTPV